MPSIKWHWILLQNEPINCKLSWNLDVDPVRSGLQGRTSNGPDSTGASDGTSNGVGGVAKWSKATVCKTVIRRFESARRLLFTCLRHRGNLNPLNAKRYTLNAIRYLLPWAQRRISTQNRKSKIVNSLRPSPSVLCHPFSVWSLPWACRRERVGVKIMKFEGYLVFSY